MHLNMWFIVAPSVPNIVVCQVLLGIYLRLSKLQRCFSLQETLWVAGASICLQVLPNEYFSPAFLSKLFSLKGKTAGLQVFPMFAGHSNAGVDSILTVFAGIAEGIYLLIFVLQGPLHSQNTCSSSSTNMACRSPRSTC